MRGIILEKLKEIEEKENVRIIHCIESGSRAWGFASPDSDYDVRYIYVRPREYYLRLDKTRDVIEWQLDDVLDINGWDIQKALRLLHKSNPTVFEWNNSPVIYKTTDEWQEISRIIAEYFSSKSGLWHYLSMAKSNYRGYLRTEQVKLKKYFYVLRPILACQWILDKKSPPPMLFEELVRAEADEKIQGYIDSLLKMKINTPEKKLINRIEELNTFIEEQLGLIEEKIKELPEECEKNWDELNKIFLKIIG